jgi:hypothetical protein
MATSWRYSTSALLGPTRSSRFVDHWTLRDGKAISLWTAYFEPQAVLQKLGIKLAADSGMNAGADARTHGPEESYPPQQQQGR